MDTTEPKETEPSPTGYAQTHCRQCAAGWTRIGIKGGTLTVCLLDREPVLADMTSCDRYELRRDNTSSDTLV